MYKEFRTDKDLEVVVNELNISRDFYYYDSNKTRTQDVNDVLNLIDENGFIDGCIVVELHHVNGYIDPVEIPITICCEQWDEEEQCFMVESYSINGVEEW